MNAYLCPLWCGGEHPPKAVHWREVGELTIAGRSVSVVIIQCPLWLGIDPVVTLSTWRGKRRTSYVEVCPDYCEDMAELLTVCGKHALADLVRRAGAILSEEASIVWDPTIPPGGYVCAAPAPAGGPGIPHPEQPRWICGYPVESEPCPEHSQAGGEGR